VKKQLLLLVALFSTHFLFAQDTLVQWNASVEKLAEKGYYKIIFKGELVDGWHAYSKTKAEASLDDPQLQFSSESISIKDPWRWIGSSSNYADPIFGNIQVPVYKGILEGTVSIQISGTIPSSIKVLLSAYVGKGDEFRVVEEELVIALEDGAATETTTLLLKELDLANPIEPCGGAIVEADSSLWKIFLLGLLGGLIALLTPCVFPMIPVTVSFFTKRSSNRKQAIKNGVLYGFFIFLIYVAASIPFHILGNVQPEIFNTISTNAWLNIAFFLIFLFFAASFFGYFEITLPSGIASKADSKSGLGSIGGIFFMAITLAIVSFSCTGPILGSLLVGSLSGGAWQLTAGMAGFGVALALPFGLFAIFPNWLQSLPKSGGWLDTVKKTLAFLELALALKFLSNADLVMHWGLLKREVFIGSWILIGAGLTLYLFGKIQLPHDVKGAPISTGRKIAGVIALAFTIYLIPGVTSSSYANLKLLSGFPPPMSYSIYGKDNVHNKGVEANVSNDFEAALAMAKESGKPLLIDFTGWACVNCRKMEENVWTDPEVSKYIKEQFILVSLYVDDRAVLSADKQIINYITKDGNKKDILTQGDLWATFQAENFSQVTQPLYVILNHDKKLVNHPVGYTPNIKEYLSWLTCGKEAFYRSSK
jgi:thiol:disulfide interchange protein DsbD